MVICGHHLHAGGQSATVGMLPPSDSDEDEEEVKKPAPAKKEAGQVLSAVTAQAHCHLCGIKHLDQ